MVLLICVSQSKDTIAIMTMLTAILGLIFSCYQWWKKVQSERSERFSNLIHVLRKDIRQIDILYQIDYNKFHYDENFHAGDIEGEMDAFLSFYEYILYMKEKHIIGKKEFEFFEYDIIRIVQNRDLQTYFFNLYHFSQYARTPFSYRRILKYAKKHKYVHDSFFDKNSIDYYHVLNF